MITYAMDHKQIAIQLLSTIVIQTFNTTVIIIIIHFVIIPAKIIVAQTQMLEDAADIENNIINTLKAYSTKHVL